MAARKIHRLAIQDMVKTRGESDRKIRIIIPEFRVWPGEFVAVSGSNGSGKSTLLDMIGLILSPDRVARFSLNTGSFLDINELSQTKKQEIRRRYFAYALQTGGLLEFLTIRQNIELAAKLAGKKNVSLNTVALKLGIETILHKRPGKVSGGQRQKAAIARALIQQASLILADEPTAAMDSPSASELMQTFKTQTRKIGSSLIMVTHDTTLVKDIADRFYHFQVAEKKDNFIASVLLEKRRS